MYPIQNEVSDIFCRSQTFALTSNNLFMCMFMLIGLIFEWFVKLLHCFNLIQKKKFQFFTSNIVGLRVEIEKHPPTNSIINCRCRGLTINWVNFGIIFSLYCGFTFRRIVDIMTKIESRWSHCFWFGKKIFYIWIENLLIVREMQNIQIFRSAFQNGMDNR